MNDEQEAHPLTLSPAHPVPRVTNLIDCYDMPTIQLWQSIDSARIKVRAMLELQLAVAKIPRHGADESGDTLEIIERPGGGFSVVLVDGQGSGRGAKTLSNLVVTRAIAQLKDA